MDLSIGSIVKIKGDRSAAKNSIEQIAQIVKWTSTEISSELRVGLKLQQAVVVTDGKLEHLIACSSLFEQPTPIEVERFMLERAQVNPILEPHKTGIGKAIIVN